MRNAVMVLEERLNVLTRENARLEEQRREEEDGGIQEDCFRRLETGRLRTIRRGCFPKTAVQFFCSSFFSFFY